MRSITDQVFESTPTTIGIDKVVRSINVDGHGMWQEVDQPGKELEAAVVQNAFRKQLNDSKPWEVGNASAISDISSGQPKRPSSPKVESKDNNLRGRKVVIKRRVFPKPTRNI